MIFYLSGTGNTRWAAHVLGEVLHEKLVDISLIHDDIQDEKTFVLDQSERIGFCFPVHGWRPPILFRQFIAKMNLKNAEGHYCWALCTAGDDIGMSMEYLNDDLAKKGLHADSIFSLLMPESYVGLPFMDVDKPKNENSKKRKASEDLKKIADIVTRREKGITMTYKGHWPRINSYLLGAAFVNWLITDKPFHVNEKRCIGCGKCVDSCVTGNIVSKVDGTPQWLHNGRCLICFACYHHCPVHAIEYGNRTKNKGQYYYK